MNQTNDNAKVFSVERIVQTLMTTITVSVRLDDNNGVDANADESVQMFEYSRRVLQVWPSGPDVLRRSPQAADASMPYMYEGGGVSLSLRLPNA